MGWIQVIPFCSWMGEIRLIANVIGNKEGHHSSERQSFLRESWLESRNCLMPWGKVQLISNYWVFKTGKLLICLTGNWPEALCGPSRCSVPLALEHDGTTISATVRSSFTTLWPLVRTLQHDVMILGYNGTTLGHEGTFLGYGGVTIDLTLRIRSKSRPSCPRVVP